MRLPRANSGRTGRFRGPGGGNGRRRNHPNAECGVWKPKRGILKAETHKRRKGEPLKCGVRIARQTRERTRSSEVVFISVFRVVRGQNFSWLCGRSRSVGSLSERGLSNFSREKFGFAGAARGHG